MLKRNILLLLLVGYWGIVYAQQMNTLWRKQIAKTDDSGHDAAPLRQFRDGNYAMFVHWGLHSALASEWNGKTYYGRW